MSTHTRLYFGTAALVAQVLVFGGCSSSGTSMNPLTGTGGSTGSGTGGSTGSGTGGSSGFTGPVGDTCPSGVKNKGPCTTEAACFNTCGPLKSGIKNCACAAGMWSCPTCAFDPTHDYSCYKVTADTVACPADPTDTSGGNLPQAGSPCTLTPCKPCGSGTANAYRDSGGIPKIGWCVCSAADGTGTYSCASTAEWAPQ